MDGEENKNMFDGRESETQFISEQNQNNPNKNIIGIVVLIIVLIVGGFFVFKNKMARNTGQEKQEPKNVVIPQVVKISESNLQKELPQGFPKSIPLNDKTKVIESYSATYPNSTIKQSTIAFESLNTPKENYDFYENWTEKNGFKIINKTNKEPNLFLYARKQQDNKTIDLNITILKSEKDNKSSKINISYAKI